MPLAALYLREGRLMPLFRTGLSLLGFLVFSLAGCAHGQKYPADEVARPASGLPSRFVYDASNYNPDSLPMGDCRTPMTDPSDHTVLVMVRIVKDKRADYQVPEGHYGVKAGELLRINCRTSAAIGIVPR
jgi:hypothetical protein